MFTKIDNIFTVYTLSLKCLKLSFLESYQIKYSDLAESKII